MKQRVLSDTRGSTVLSQGSHLDWKMGWGGGIFQSGNCEQIGKVRENHTKKTGKVREFKTNVILLIFSVI